MSENKDPAWLSRTDALAEIERLRAQLADSVSLLATCIATEQERDEARAELESGAVYDKCRQLIKERDEAREAARWMCEAEPSKYELEKWPWLEDE